jgi:hypothetical protein
MNKNKILGKTDKPAQKPRKPETKKLQLMCRPIARAVGVLHAMSVNRFRGVMQCSG